MSTVADELGRFVRSLKYDDIGTTKAKIVRRLMAGPTRIRVEQYLRYNRRYGLKLNPFKVVYIDPSKVINKHYRPYRKEKSYLSHIMGGGLGSP